MEGTPFHIFEDQPGWNARWMRFAKSALTLKISTKEFQQYFEVNDYDGFREILRREITNRSWTPGWPSWNARWRRLEKQARKLGISEEILDDYFEIDDHVGFQELIRQKQGISVIDQSSFANNKRWIRFAYKAQQVNISTEEFKKYVDSNDYDGFRKFLRQKQESVGFDKSPVMGTFWNECFKRSKILNINEEEFQEYFKTEDREGFEELCDKKSKILGLHKVKNPDKWFKIADFAWQLFITEEEFKKYCIADAYNKFENIIKQKSTVLGIAYPPEEENHQTKPKKAKPNKSKSKQSKKQEVRLIYSSPYANMNEKWRTFYRQAKALGVSDKQFMNYFKRQDEKGFRRLRQSMKSKAEKDKD